MMAAARPVRAVGMPVRIVQLPAEYASSVSRGALGSPPPTAYRVLPITAAATYLAWYAAKLVYWSWRLNDVSQGQDVTPLWIAQTPMAVGAVIMAICLIDNLITLLVSGRDNIGDDLDNFRAHAFNHEAAQ